MAVSTKRVQSGKITKSKSQKEEKKRSGNNLYGAKGKPKCANCRLARRSCTFDSPDQRCHGCVRKGYDCGEKTRRGGAQDTVRISVLEQLALDNPTWTLNDAIAHLSGDEDHLQRCVEESPESDFSEATFLQFPPDCVDPADIMDLGKTIEFDGSGLKMEFVTPEEHLRAFKTESVTPSTYPSPSPSTPFLPARDDFQYSATALTPQFPSIPTFPTVFAHQFDPSLLFPPSFEFSTNLDEEWNALAPGPYDEDL